MDTSDKCIRFFYRFLGNANDVIDILSTDEQLMTTTLKTIDATHWSNDYWVPVLVKLHPAVNRITIKGTRGVGISGMALDDNEINQCSNFQGTM
jgi:hypothetical protein